MHRGENAPFATSDNAPYVVFSLSVSRCFLQFYSADLPNAIAHASGFDADSNRSCDRGSLVDSWRLERERWINVEPRKVPTSKRSACLSLQPIPRWLLGLLRHVPRTAAGAKS